LKEVQDFIKQSNIRIAGYETEVARLKSLLPFEQMTMEDFKDAYPDLVSCKFIILSYHIYEGPGLDNCYINHLMFSVHTVKRICLWVAIGMFCVEYNSVVKRTTNNRLRMVQLLLSFLTLCSSLMLLVAYWNNTDC